jgi:hypothetical protein
MVMALRRALQLRASAPFLRSAGVSPTVFAKKLSAPQHDDAYLAEKGCPGGMFNRVTHAARRTQKPRK